MYRLKQLQSIVSISVVSIHRDSSNSWKYDGTSKSDAIDPIEGFRNFKELYKKADPDYVSLKVFEDSCFSMLFLDLAGIWMHSQYFVLTPRI